MHQDAFRTRLIVVAMALLVFVPWAVRAADVVELRSGAKVSGAILSRTEKDVTIRYKVGTYTYTRTYPLSLILAITANDQREVVGELDASAPASRPAGPPPPPPGARTSPPLIPRRPARPAPGPRSRP